jgi:hypothetical protein
MVHWKPGLVIACQPIQASPDFAQPVDRRHVASSCFDSLAVAVGLLRHQCMIRYRRSAGIR